MNPGDSDRSPGSDDVEEHSIGGAGEIESVSRCIYDERREAAVPAAIIIHVRRATAIIVYPILTQRALVIRTTNAGSAFISTFLGSWLRRRGWGRCGAWRCQRRDVRVMVITI